MELKSNGPYLRPSKSSHNPVLSCNEIWILRPLSKAAEKTGLCFAWYTEHQYWTVTVQYLCRVKKILMTSNVLPLNFAPRAQAKIQMLTTSSRIVTILLKSFLKSLGLYWSWFQGGSPKHSGPLHLGISFSKPDSFLSHYIQKLQIQLLALLSSN